MTARPAEADPIKVLIVDDSAAARAGFRSLIAADSSLRVMAMAADPFEAVEKMRTAVPDVILLDLQMPRMDGLTFLSKIMAQRPIPVVVCSSLTDAGSRTSIKALEMGAAEVIAKPDLASEGKRQEAQIRLCDAIRAAAQSKRGGRKLPEPLQHGPKLTADEILPPARPGQPRPPRTGPIVAIGASTGGTEALLKVLQGLPADAPPVVIVQHMPERFTAAFAARLDRSCRVSVREGATGDALAIGTVLIAPGNRHMLLRRTNSAYGVTVREGPYVARHRPSVDVLFRSVAQVAGDNALGILMTGMGDDGARGMVEMREAGARTLAQDEASCVVYGMPREAVRMGGAERSVALSRIPAEIMAWAEARAGVRS